MIAALGDLHIGEMARCGEHARRQIVVEIQVRIGGSGLPSVDALANGDDAVDFVGADQGVDFRHILFDVAAIALDQATGHDQVS
jgi:hypothetical protein